MTPEQLNFELQRGARFVIFQYAISIIVLSFRRASDVYFIRAGEETTSKSIGFTLLTLVAGWWGIPFGPIFTVQARVTTFRGGKDVTREVVSSLAKPAPVPVG
jgi:hypothetical protein